MNLKDFLLHLLIPRESNNHRAQALHFSAISFYITVLLVFQIALTGVTGLRPGVLGYASNISVSDLLKDSNNKRAQAGVPALSLNDQLTNAAAGKAGDMFQSQYWAHVSPTGKTPWDFIIGAGYNYLFAGENLARDFNDSQAVVNAWMNSPAHRDNLLSNRFHEVGFAVVNGKYGNSETTLVVQMFGTKAGAPPTVAAPETAPTPSSTPNAPTLTLSPTASASATPSALPTTPAPTEGQGNGIVLQEQTSSRPTDVLGLTKNVSSGLIVALVALLMIDSILVYRRKTVRLSGHNLAHLMFLLGALVIINLISRGTVI